MSKRWIKGVAALLLVGFVYKLQESQETGSAQPRQEHGDDVNWNSEHDDEGATGLPERSWGVSKLDTVVVIGADGFPQSDMNDLSPSTTDRILHPLRTWRSQTRMRSNNPMGDVLAPSSDYSQDPNHDPCRYSQRRRKLKGAKRAKRGKGDETTGASGTNYNKSSKKNGNGGDLSYWRYGKGKGGVQSNWYYQGKGKAQAPEEAECDENDEDPRPSARPTLLPTARPTLPPVAEPQPVSAEPSVNPSSLLSVSPSETSFECGTEPTTDTIDIMIVMDESRDMDPERTIIQENVGLLFNTLDTATEGLFRVGLVGFTGPDVRGENGGNVPVTVDPELKSVLTNDQTAFQAAADSLSVLKGTQENHRGALLVVAQNQVQDLSTNVVPLAGPNEAFPSSRGFCAIVITMERNSAYEEFPAPTVDEVILEYNRTNSAIFFVGTGEEDSRRLPRETGGAFVTAGQFAEDPATILVSFADGCIQRLCSNRLIV